MEIQFKDMMRIASRFDSGCCGTDITVQVFDGTTAELWCGGGVVDPEPHKLDGHSFYKKQAAESSE